MSVFFIRTIASIAFASRMLEKDHDAPIFDLAQSIVRMNDEIQSVVHANSFHGMSTQQDVPLDMIDAQVGDNVLASPSLS